MQTVATATNVNDTVDIHDLDFQNMMRFADANKDGFVNKAELEATFDQYGIEGVTADEFRDYYDNCNGNGGNCDGMIDENEMLNAWNDMK